MRRISFLASLAMATAALAADGKDGGAGDWPKWLGPDGDNICKEKGLLQKWPEGGPKKLWSKPVGIGYSSPVTRDGKVYLFSTIDGKDTLACYSADDGKEQWAKSYDNSWKGQYPGVRATPTIAGENIFTYGGGGDLVCWSLKGEPAWNVNILKETASKNLKWGLASSPTVAGDLIYVQSGDGGSVAVAVGRKDGKVQWKSEAKGMGSYAAVLPIDAKGDKQVVVFAGKALVGMNAADGKTLWTFPWTTAWDVHAATPLFRDGLLFVTSGYNHGCMTIKIDGAKADKTGEKKEPHSKIVPPVLDGDSLFVNSEGPLMCLNWPDGKVKWTNNDLGLGIGGSFVRFGDKLIAMTENGKLVLAEANAEGCKLLAKLPMFRGGENWSMPVISRGKLYLKGPSELVCLDIQEK